MSYYSSASVPRQDAKGCKPRFFQLAASCKFVHSGRPNVSRLSSTRANRALLQSMSNQSAQPTATETAKRLQNESILRGTAFPKSVCELLFGIRSGLNHLFTSREAATSVSPARKRREKLGAFVRAPEEWPPRAHSLKTKTAERTRSAVLKNYFLVRQ